MARKPRADPRLERLASVFTPEWLAAQRWYRAKSRSLATVELADGAAIPGTPGWLLILAATEETGARSRYLVPAVADGGSFREPRDGEGVWQHLAGLIAADGRLRTGAGWFSFSAMPALDRLLPGGAGAVPGLSERRLGVEQSNTSVALGTRLILKCYRLLEAGVNPEVEVNAFLTEVGFLGAPTLGGSAAYAPRGGPPCAAALLQELVESETDGWNWVQACLAGGAGDRDRATAALGQVGTLTKELHLALASRPGVPGFPSRTASSGEVATWHSRATSQLEAALAAVAGGPHRRLLDLAPRLRRRLDALRTARHADASRIHGDYHLGQLLRTGEGFSVIDFEGEPARPLAERREPSSPLRDVAGMLRSIDYAARVARDAGRGAETDGWAAGARESFLAAYDRRLSDHDGRLLDAFEIEKACYEVTYEANNRPAWASIPLDALERLANRGP
jgi:trehalose synthase-fused probable maltokinase